RAGYKTIYVALKTSTVIAQELKARWLKAIDNRCPVSDNLANTTPIIFHLSHL
ncbi:MAG: putative OsmC-like protein, partial [Marivirga sp.]